MRDLFRDQKLYEQALTHTSWWEGREGRATDDYERLEFLGDAVLQLYTTELLYTRLPSRSAGDLTYLRQRLVNRGTFARLAQQLGLGAAARLGRGEDTAAGRARPGLLADLFEAVIGALYLDQGADVARREAHRLLSPVLDELLSEAEGADRVPLAAAVRSAKNRLQEYTQSRERRLGTPRYEIVEKVGADNLPTFHVRVLLGERELALGVGSTRQDAEADAAARALDLLCEGP